MKGKRRTKRNKIATMIMTVVVCVGILSATAYAWFSLTNSPSVDNLVLQAGTDGNLKICLTADGTYGDNLDLSSVVPANACLRPLTSIDGKTFYKPVYSADGVVTAVESSPIATLSDVANRTESNGGYLVQTEFYLKATSSETKEIHVCLAGSGLTSASDTYTKIENSTTNDKLASSIRVSFTSNGNTAILEPNADVSITGATTQYAMNGWNAVTTIKQGKNYSFLNSVNSKYELPTSENVITMNTNTPTKITMTIWVEGADKDCINDIAGNVANSQIQFTCTDIN